MSPPKTLYLDQNAWIILAKGAWDKTAHPREHGALVWIVEAINAGLVRIPLSFTNLYETFKVNVPQQRYNLANTQAIMSGGLVFRGRRRILTEALSIFLATKFGIERAPPCEDWYLSDLFFEAAADYSPEVFGFQLSDRLKALMRENPAEMLLDFLSGRDEENRRESVKMFSARSTGLIADIEGRRAALASETLALRKRAYSGLLLATELELILATGRAIGLDWKSFSDIAPIAKAIVSEIPALFTEREIAVRLEDQDRAVNENDLRDMSAFATILPLTDIIVAEKQFSNLARQSGLDKRYKTKILTSLFDLSESDFEAS